MSGPALAAGVIVVIAVGAGIWMYVNWGTPSDDPVEPGPAMTGRTSPTTVASGEAGLIDTSGPSRMSWTWVVTTVSFAGELSGRGGQWTFNASFPDGDWTGSTEGGVTVHGDEVLRLSYRGTGSGSSPSDETAPIEEFRLEAVSQ